MAKYQFMIGLTQNTMTNLEDFGIFPPKSSFRVGVNRINLGDGTVRDVGYSIVIWFWGFLTLFQRDLLRQYCPGSSSHVWIRTRINDGDRYADAKAIMIWPIEEQREIGGIRIEFSIEFRLLEGWQII